MFFRLYYYLADSPQNLIGQMYDAETGNGLEFGPKFTLPARLLIKSTFS